MGKLDDLHLGVQQNSLPNEGVVDSEVQFDAEPAEDDLVRLVEEVERKEEEVRADCKDSGDRKKYCQGWAEKGQCNENPSYMWRNCCASCLRKARKEIAENKSGSAQRE